MLAFEPVEFVAIAVNVSSRMHLRWAHDSPLEAIQDKLQRRHLMGLHTLEQKGGDRDITGVS